MSRYPLIDIGLTDAVSRGLGLGYHLRQLNEQQRWREQEASYRAQQDQQQQANADRTFNLQRERFALEDQRYQNAQAADAADRAGLAQVFQREVAAPDAAQQILDRGPSGFFDAVDGAQRRVGGFEQMSPEGQRAVLGPIMTERREMSREARQRAAMLEAEQQKIDNLQRFLSTKGGTPKQKAAILSAAQAKLDRTVEEMIKDLDPLDAQQVRDQLARFGVTEQQMGQALPMIGMRQAGVPSGVLDNMLAPAKPTAQEYQAALDSAYSPDPVRRRAGAAQLLAWGRSVDLPEVRMGEGGATPDRMTEDDKNRIKAAEMRAEMAAKRERAIADRFFNPTKPEEDGFDQVESAKLDTVDENEVAVLMLESGGRPSKEDVLDLVGEQLTRRLGRAPSPDEARSHIRKLFGRYVGIDWQTQQGQSQQP